LIEMELNPLNPRPENIWEFRQNKIRLVLRDARDLLGMNPKQLAGLANILVSRGICKWMRNRSLFIWLKEDWKDEIKRLNEEIKTYPRGSAKRAHIAGELAALNRCREAVRGICKSERWCWGVDAQDEREVVKFVDAGEDLHG
jgi:hypothetical protein